MTVMSSLNTAWLYVNHERAQEQAKLIRSELRRRKVGRTPGTAFAGAFACMVVAILVFAERPPRQRALEATAQMEQLATILSRSQRIAPDTAREIARLIQQPSYDCQQVPECGPALELRNLTARAKLMMLIGSVAPPHEPASAIAGSRKCEQAF